MPKVTRILNENEAEFAQIITQARNKNMISNKQRRILYQAMKNDGLSNAQAMLFAVLRPNKIKRLPQA